MTDLDISEYTTYDAFVREWHTDDLGDVALDDTRESDLLTEDDTRLLWQLLGQLSDDEVLIESPDWLADEKVGYVDGATPTMFDGRIDRETEKAIHVVDSAAARPLLKLAHRIQHLENGDSDDDRREWLDYRLQELRDDFENRDDVTGFSEEWIPKSQFLHAIRRLTDSGHFSIR